MLSEATLKPQFCCTRATKNQARNMFFLVGESSELSTKKKQTNKATWTENCCEKRHQVRPSVSRWPHRCKPKQPDRNSKRRNSILQVPSKKLTIFVFRGLRCIIGRVRAVTASQRFAKSRCTLKDSCGERYNVHHTGQRSSEKLAGIE